MAGSITLNYSDVMGVRAALALMYAYGFEDFTGVVIERISNQTSMLTLPDPESLPDKSALLTITPTQRNALLTNGRVTTAFSDWMKGKIIRTTKSTIQSYEREWNDAQVVINDWQIT